MDEDQEGGRREGRRGKEGGWRRARKEGGGKEGRGKEGEGRREEGRREEERKEREGGRMEEGQEGGRIDHEEEKKEEGRREEEEGRRREGEWGGGGGGGPEEGECSRDLTHLSMQTNNKHVHKHTSTHSTHNKSCTYLQPYLPMQTRNS